MTEDIKVKWGGNRIRGQLESLPMICLGLSDEGSTYMAERLLPPSMQILN